MGKSITLSLADRGIDSSIDITLSILTLRSDSYEQTEVINGSHGVGMSVRTVCATFVVVVCVTLEGSVCVTFDVSICVTLDGSTCTTLSAAFELENTDSATWESTF
ncbi:hypothetical protein DPMN_045730 [Dreissena polymorpha]|uniref:Uncharacterized protein n=1 Tax=Dreissena polymorpha TaxID=45954 RepID=A0A9D4D8B5_DREPO|nr:hypothetical protein DPMN_045730 [Dreissena polymorpha]